MRKTSLHLDEALGHAPSDKRIDILRRIGQTGSISEAARQAGVSYKAAWQAIETLGNLAGEALLERAVGGAGGGGAQLTPAGERLLRAADALASARRDALKRFEGSQAGGGGSPGLVGLGLRTSMRNQVPCTVKALRRAGASTRVELSLANGARLFSRITDESAELLGLHAGQRVLALWKATAVQVAAQMESRPGYNVLTGTVMRLSAARQGTELALELAPGLQLVGFAPLSHGLRKRQTAMAGVEDSAVVIAVEA
jgi:molybdate transport system regulatory protein